MAKLGVAFLFLGIILTSAFDLAEGLISIGYFYLSPARLYILMLAGLIMFFLLAGKKISLGGYGKSFFLLVGAFTCFVLFSVFKSHDVFYSFKRFLNYSFIFLLPLLAYLFCRFTLVRSSLNRIANVTVLWAVACAVLFSFFGFVQLFTGMFVVEPGYRKFFSFSFLRVNSVFVDCNFFAYFLLLPLFLNFGIYYAKDKFMNLAIRMFVFFVLMCALIITGSRGGMLGFLAGVFFMGYDRLFSKIALFRYFKYPLLMLLPVGIMVVVFLNFGTLIESAGDYDAENSGGLARLMVWYSTLVLFVNNPLLGVGPGNIVTQGKGESLAGFAIEKFQYDKISELAPHSTYIEILTESGIIAFVLFLSIFIFILRKTSLFNKSKKDTASRLLYMFHYALIASLTANLYLSYYSYFLFFMTGIFLFFVEQKMKENAAPA